MVYKEFCFLIGLLAGMPLYRRTSKFLKIAIVLSKPTASSYVLIFACYIG